MSSDADRARRFERRLYLHAFAGRCFFYVPVLILHLSGSLEPGDGGQRHAAALSVVALFAVGIALAEYPSGVFADWAGRGRALIVGSLLYASAVLLYVATDALWVLGLGQLLLGVASAFRSGADTALLYAHLEAAGALERYGAAIARLRFWNLAGITLSSATGGLLYAWWPPSVFWATSVAVLLGTLPLLGLPERRAPARPRSYGRALRDGLGALRESPRLRVLVPLGGAGHTFFLFAYWSTQSYLAAVGASPAVMGATVAAVPVLQSLTMPLSARLSRGRTRYAPVFLCLLGGLGLAFAAVALGHALVGPVLGAAALVAASSCAVLFRNLVNVRLQPLAADAVRASVTSLETWTGSLCYLALFPVAGATLDAAGLSAGYAVVAATLALSCGPLLWLGGRRGL